jgi:hypothetical protein
MFKYTREAVDKIIDDFRKLSRFFKYSSQIFTVTYLVYAIIANVGNLYANIILLSLFIAYTIFDLVIDEKENRLVEKVVRRTYKWLRISIKAFTLGILIYGIYTATTSTSPISIILATLMIIVWVLQVLLELVIMIVEDEKDLVVAGLKKDMEDIKRPVTEVGNFFKRVTGQEVVVNEEEDSREIKILKKRMEKRKERQFKN